MRTAVLPLMLFTATLLAGCEFWPRDLEPLAESISRQVSGETTAWLAAGDVVVIEVAGSPLYRAPEAELEAVATGIAEQAIGYIEVNLESIAITFHQGEVADDPDDMRQFIFLVMENRPVLPLDAFGKRLVLPQAIMSKALFVCVSTVTSEVKS